MTRIYYDTEFVEDGSVADPDADVYRAALRRAEETIARIANIAQAHACAPLADEHGSPSVPGDPRASQSPTGALSDPHTEEIRKQGEAR